MTSTSARLIAASATLIGLAALGASAYLFALNSHPTHDPHGGALIFLPALLLAIVSAAFLIVAVAVWRQSRGWQLLIGVLLILMLLTALVGFGVV